MPSDVRYLPELPIGRREPSCLAFSEETGKHRNASQSRGAYVEAPRETLAGGGDTDTNACIVGGLGQTVLTIEFSLRYAEGELNWTPFVGPRGVGFKV